MPGRISEDTPWDISLILRKKNLEKLEELWKLLRTRTCIPWHRTVCHQSFWVFLRVLRSCNFFKKLSWALSYFRDISHRFSRSLPWRFTWDPGTWLRRFLPVFLLEYLLWDVFRIRKNFRWTLSQDFFHGFWRVSCEISTGFSVNISHKVLAAISFSGLSRLFIAVVSVIFCSDHLFLSLYHRYSGSSFPDYPGVFLGMCFGIAYGIPCEKFMETYRN